MLNLDEIGLGHDLEESSSPSRSLSIMETFAEYAPILRGIIVAIDNGELSNCILTAAVVRSVLGYCGIPNSYMPARVSVYNATAVDWLMRWEETKHLDPPMGTKVHIIGGNEHGDGDEAKDDEVFGVISERTWNGHLTNIAKTFDSSGNEVYWLIDLSIDQTANLAHAIDPAPFATIIEPPRLSPYYTFQQSEPGDPAFCFITYEPFWRNETFKNSSYYHNMALITRATKLLLRSLSYLSAFSSKEITL